MLGTLSNVLLFGLELVAIAYARCAIKTARTPQGAVGWAILLVAAPYLTVPLYHFPGHRKYRGCEISRQKNEEVL